MYRYDHNGAEKRRIMFIRILICALIIHGSDSIYNSSPIHLLQSLLVWWVIGIALIAAAGRIHRKLAARGYRKQIEAGIYSEFLGEHTLELDKGVLTLTRGFAKLEIGTDARLRIEQDEYSIYVYYGSLSCIPIPLAAFAQEGGKADFLRLLKNRSSN